MNCLSFPKANTNLFPRILKGNPVHDERGLIPAFKNELGQVSILLQFTPEELKMVNLLGGKFFLTFNKQDEVSSINSITFPPLLAQDLDKKDDFEIQGTDSISLRPEETKEDNL